ncbi:MAG: SPOR domain-containing protein [Desulfobacterales bacterium]|nr:SPOR domain-containing protein [Desulfobacterales bacterium]
MNQKASKSKKKASSKGSRPAVQLTRKELFVWLGVAFLAMLWMFTLGVIVGRGLSPVRFDVEKLKGELVALKQEALRREEAGYKKDADTLSGKRNLDFYDLLTDKKEQARLKSVSKAKQQPLKPKSEKETTRKPGPKTLPKSKVNQKEKKALRPSLAKKRSTRGTFTVQVLSVKDPVRAEKMVSYLKGKDYVAYKVTAHIPGKGTYHRVRVGHFKDRREAARAAEKLGGEKLEPLIIRE